MEWNQDSTDVTILLRVPRGTKAKELSVALDSQRIAVRLGWYGSLFEGAPLHAVRGADSRWCLEDDVVRLTLAKAREGQWWKAAVRGGEERTYHQLLHDAVHADERVKPFEELDEDAKELMESILERQEYVAAGMLDPEGFDDFRVVIGESSLKG
ncbi:hypothetical protein H632_c5075p0 [Helicosporidium sp. ATCC 50920]|nr:hypothetical protein H632_c5075p0 [Helicosporidium sp. ATCC 50920]|eukprot:KDD71419.1 hypothetical protein H632_c5075p0 [Helicosporidium sp. ATCC 50920]